MPKRYQTVNPNLLTIFIHMLNAKSIYESVAKPHYLKITTMGTSSPSGVVVRDVGLVTWQEGVGSNPTSDNNFFSYAE